MNPGERQRLGNDLRLLAGSSSGRAESALRLIEKKAGPMSHRRCAGPRRAL